MLPYNIAGYGLLLSLIAKEVDMIPHMLYYHAGDAHVYEEHKSLIPTQLAREPLSLPLLRIDKEASLFNCTLDDLDILDYQTSGDHIPYLLK